MSRISNLTDQTPSAAADRGQYLHLPGIHVLLDIWRPATYLECDLIEEMLRLAARVAGATVLDVKLHSFGESGGITGVAILAESHITIHTWPELEYVAMDIFMCGACSVRACSEVIKDFLKPEIFTVSEYQRGVPDATKDVNVNHKADN